MAGKRSLRYTDPSQMPDGMRRLLQSQQQAAAANVDKMRDNAARSADRVVAMLANQPIEKGDARRSKMGNVATTVDGIRFDSKREAKYYEQLKLRVIAGEVSHFLRQTALHLPGGTKLVIDFLVFYTDGRVEYVDTKGWETPVFKIKRKEVEHHYPFRITLA